MQRAPRRFRPFQLLSGVALVVLGACSESCADGLTLGATVDYADWSLIEPDHPMIAPAVATNLDAAICIDRLGATSVGRANAQAALLQLNDLSGVDINVTVRDINCGSDSTIFANPGLAELLVTEVVEHCRGDTLRATGGVCYQNPGAVGDTLWTINDCAQILGCEAQSAVIMLRQSNFSGANEPSVGVVAHELGHALGLVHGYWSPDECTAGTPPTQVRAESEQHLMSHTVVRGTGRGFTQGNDLRSGRVSAYTLAYLQERYASASTSDTLPDWYAHEMVIKRDNCGGQNPVTPATTWESPDFNPTQLCLDAPSGLFVDCTTGARQPFTLQFSSRSAENCVDGAYPILTVDGTEVARGPTITPDCSAPLAQYEWTVSPEIAMSDLPAGTVLPYTGSVRFEVVSESALPEADSTDDAVVLSVTFSA